MNDDTPNSIDDPEDDTTQTVAGQLLQSLQHHGVKYIFANLGTDHTPLLEAAAHFRDKGQADQIPSFIVCPHEFVAMSAAHGYAAATGNPQAVLVHVDVGTQNLGAAMHNAHRANAPVFVIAGLAPTTDVGYPGSRDHPVHYFQDVFDQPGIVREYCRWTEEYRPPTDPNQVVSRGLERAVADNPGPVYVSATREALETEVDPSTETEGTYRQISQQAAAHETIHELAERVQSAETPLVITSNLGRNPAHERVSSLVDFAEAAGAGVIEHTPTGLCFPRDHDLHLGFDPAAVFEDADLLLLLDTDVPWVPADGSPPDDVQTIQIDPDPSKRAYPHWPFDIETTIVADPASTLEAVAKVLQGRGIQQNESGWEKIIGEQSRSASIETQESDVEGDHLTAARVSEILNEFIQEDTIIVEDAVTSGNAILENLELSEPGSYFSKGGAGLGWAGGAAVGVKLANPDSRVFSLVGDGSYLFTNPTACAWLAAEHDAPTLTVVFDNQGWGAVKKATRAEHPAGLSVAAGVPESRFDTSLDLSAPASAVDAYTRVVRDQAQLRDALSDAVDAIDDGRPAVLDVKIA